MSIETYFKNDILIKKHFFIRIRLYVRELKLFFYRDLCINDKNSNDIVILHKINLI